MVTGVSLVSFATMNDDLSLNLQTGHLRSAGSAVGDNCACDETD